MKGGAEPRRSARACPLDQPEGYDFFSSVQEKACDHSGAEVGYGGILASRGAIGDCWRELVNAIINDHTLPIDGVNAPKPVKPVGIIVGQDHFRFDQLPGMAGR